MPRFPDGRPAVVPCYAVPFLNPADLAELDAPQVARHRIPLLNQLAVLGDPPPAARKRTVVNAMAFLSHACAELLEVARHDLDALDTWRTGVEAGRAEFEGRYRREYLDGAHFGRFETARDKLLGLLELPGAGRALTAVLWALRAPYRIVRAALGRMGRPDTVYLSELAVLDGAFRAWLDQLRSEALHRAGSHPLWKHLAQGFEGDLTAGAREKFIQEARRFERTEADVVEATSRGIYESLERNPALLNTLRCGKLALDACFVGAAVWLANFGWWSLLAAPLAASATHQAVEVLGAQYVDAKREQTRSQQEALMKEHLSGPLAEWLAAWPVSGGSTYERLQRALRRVPETIHQVEQAVIRRLVG
jgi:hypothetical protein